jgi:hypothetical protein
MAAVYQKGSCIDYHEQLLTSFPREVPHDPRGIREA